MNEVLNNQPLLDAVARMQRESTRESREAVLDLVITSARFLAPADILEQADQEAQITFQLIPNQDSQPFFPAFTGWDELRKLCGPKNQQTLVLSFDDYATMVLRDKRAAGLVIDPFGCCLSFDRTMLAHLAIRKDSIGKAPQ